MKYHKNFKDQTGNKFSKWTILMRLENKNKQAIYRCRCECGIEKDVYSCNLTTNKSTCCKSCGMRKKGYETLKDHLLDNTVEKNGCLEWIGCIGKNGYGIFSFKQKNYTSHRASYLVYKGEIPEDKLIRHLCHNRKCCKPDHLELGDMKDNMADCIKANRQAKGEKSGSSKLKENDIIEIRKKFENYEFKQHELAKMYKVTKCCIAKITQRKTWKHI